MHGRVAGRGHDQSIDSALLHQRIHHRAVAAGVAHDDLDLGPAIGLGNAEQRQHRRVRHGGWSGSAVRPANAPILHPAERPLVARSKGIEAQWMDLGHLACAVNLPRRHAEYARAGTLIRGQGDGIQQVLRAIGRERRGRPHGAAQHHRLARCEQLLQKPRSFFQGIGAVRDHHTLHVRVCQMLFAVSRQPQPDAVRHVLAIDLGDLLCHQTRCSHVPQRRNGGDQIIHADLPGGVAGIGSGHARGSGNRPTCSEQNNLFFCNNHLRLLKNCSKIQALVFYTVFHFNQLTVLDRTMSDSPKLTARQQQILDLIQNAIARTGAPPTRAEIAAQLGFKSANAAEEHLQALARKGVIELVSGTSRGIRLRSDTVRNINAARGSQFNLPIPGLNQLVLPLIGRVAAGSPILAQEHVDQSYTVEGSLFQRKPDYLLKVRGMSMRDAGIMDGDLLAVQTTQEVRNGQIVVARIGDEVTVKRLRRNADLIELLPENPDYPIITVQPGEAFEIEGLAVGLIRNTMLM